MAEYIELHNSHTEKPVLVNLARLEDVTVNMYGRAMLTFSIGEYYEVDESYEEVKGLILEAK